MSDNPCGAGRRAILSLSGVALPLTWPAVGVVVGDMTTAGDILDRLSRIHFPSSFRACAGAVWGTPRLSFCHAVSGYGFDKSGRLRCRGVAGLSLWCCPGGGTTPSGPHWWPPSRGRGSPSPAFGPSSRTSPVSRSWPSAARRSRTAWFLPLRARGADPYVDPAQLWATGNWEQLTLAFAPVYNVRATAGVDHRADSTPIPRRPQE
jgi:hypothetical protein